MKIILPVHHFLPRYTAGAELYTLRLAHWLRAHGHAVEVVCVEAIDEGAPGELRVVADAYQGIPVQRLSFNLMDAAERPRWNYDNPLLGEWFAEYLRREQPDLVHFHAGYLLGIAPIVAAHNMGVPTVLTLHDYWFLCPRVTFLRGDGSLCAQVPDDPAQCAWCQCLEQRRYRAPERVSAGMFGKAARRLALGPAAGTIADRRTRVLSALGLVDAVIAPSRFLAARFAPHVPAERLRVMRYGVDTKRFGRVERRPEDGTLRIGYTGQIAQHKGVHLLVEAFCRLAARERRAELHIYGGLDAYPDYTQSLRRLASQNRHVHFHGRFENSRAAEILASLDITVVPSVWYENSPLAIMEAHAAGTPVITAALGGMAELVRDEIDGLHFQPANAADLARQLQRLLDEPDLLPRLRAGVVSPQSIDDEMREVTDIYHEVLVAATHTA